MTMSKSIPSPFKMLEDEPDVLEIYSSSRDMRRVMKKVIENKLRNLFMTKEADYDKASWAYYQAHKNGKIQALTELMQIL